MALLETRELTKYFGLVKAVDGVSVAIQEGELVGIIGPNGSGKTTFLNLLTGYIKPSRGVIYYQGKDITGFPPERITRLGIGRSFQIPQLYGRLTVLEHMLVALAARDRAEGDIWQPLKGRGRIAEAAEILSEFGLANMANQGVPTLAEGERKVLDVAISFALQPRLLLLDEPTSGVSNKDKFGIMDRLVGALKRAGVTVVFVEHDLEVVRQYAERILVFGDGQIVADGPPSMVLGGMGARGGAWEV